MLYLNYSEILLKVKSFLCWALMTLFKHVFIHFALAAIVGIIGFYITGSRGIGMFLLFLSSSVLGGFLIDLDHLIDYFFAFGFDFNLNHFFKGYQFLKTDKVYVLLHSFEIYFLITVGGLLIQNNYIIVFAQALLVHLFSDIIINKLPFRMYSFIYRFVHNFDTKYLVSSNTYKKHQDSKERFKF